MEDGSVFVQIHKRHASPSGQQRGLHSCLDRVSLSDPETSGAFHVPGDDQGLVAHDVSAFGDLVR